MRALWGTEVQVTGVRLVPGGASRESWDVRVRTAGDAQRRLILLRNADGRARDRDKNVPVEAAAMTAARMAGVPVAEIYDYGEGALGQAYLLMERLDGETIPRRLLRDEAYAAVRPGLARRLGEILARIHQVDPDSVPGLPRVDALGQVTGLYQAFAEPRPALEIGLRWLAGHRPAPHRLARSRLRPHIYRHHRRYRITEGTEEIQMRRVAGYLFGFIKPGTLKGVTG